MSGPQLRLVLPARRENVIVVRQAVAGLGEAVGLPEQRLADLKTVVAEACNNVVLHAYGEDEEGPLEVTATSDPEAVELEVRDQGTGFRPRADDHEATLGLGLPLIASLSDRFEISGGAGEGTRTRVRVSRQAPDRPSGNGSGPEFLDETAIAIEAGAAVRPVLARVIGALASRAEFSLDRLADTVLLGDVVSSHRPEDFPEGQIGISIRDREGTLQVRVGPLIDGGAERILEAMKVPGEGGSLRKLAQSMQVSRGERPGGGSAEYLEIEVAR